MSVLRNASGGSLAEPDEIVELATLYDFYGPLLKENHRVIFEDYVWNNFSLGEIAREREITRQGVYDVVKRCQAKLRGYESVLQLVHKSVQMEERLKQMEGIAADTDDGRLSEKISSLADEIRRILEI